METRSKRRGAKVADHVGLLDARQDVDPRPVTAQPPEDREPFYTEHDDNRPCGDCAPGCYVTPKRKGDE